MSQVKSWDDVSPELRKFMSSTYSIPKSHMSISDGSGDVWVKCKEGFQYRLGYFMSPEKFAHENPAWTINSDDFRTEIQYDYFITIHDGKIMMQSNFDGVMFMQCPSKVIPNEEMRD